MSANTTLIELMTSGAVAVAIGGGVQRHHIDRLARREVIPHQRAGHIRLFAAADLNEIRRVCAEHRYYRSNTEAVG